MFPHFDGWQNGFQFFGRRGVFIVSSALLLWLMTGFGGRTPGNSVTGSVRDQAGTPVAHAEVIARVPGGKIVGSALTDSQGRFHFSALRHGINLLEVRCQGCSGALEHTISVKNGQSLELNFVVSLTDQTRTVRPSPMGGVTFSKKPDFEIGGLKDPTAGGGYSDSASAQSRLMLRQYLPPSKSGVRDTISASGAEPGSTQKLSERHLERLGTLLLTHKNYEQAGILFKKAVVRFPSSARLQAGLGLSLYGLGKYDAAVKELCKAVRLSPDDSSQVLLLAEALEFAAKRNSEAAMLLERFSDLHPKDAVGHYSYGLYLWKSFRSRPDGKNLARAQTEFERAVALDPNDAAAHFQLGILYDQQKSTQRAIHEYQECIRVNPELAAAHYRLASDYRRVGQEGKASTQMAVYEKLQELNRK